MPTQQSTRSQHSKPVPSNPQPSEFNTTWQPPTSRPYETFLDHKRHSGADQGFAPLWLPETLFPFQAKLVEWALRKGRVALFEACGLGKTLQQLVWAENVVRQTNKKVLIATPLAVSWQTVQEGEKFGIACARSQDGRPAGAITVTNYEQLHKFDPTDYIGMVLDESSILKHFRGATQQTVTRFIGQMPYRLLCTATPSPNDHVELGTASEALGDLGYMDMLDRFFVMEESKRFRITELMLGRRAATGSQAAKLAYQQSQQQKTWRLKGHAHEPFWRWVCSWARACQLPSDLGYADEGFLLPPLTEQHHLLIPTTAAAGMLFTVPAVGLQEERDERKRTLEERCTLVAQLVDHDRPAVVWCHLNAEGARLAQLIPDALEVHGAMEDTAKEEAYTAFSTGEARVMITKPKIGAWGLNWQHCAHVVTFATHCYDEQTEVLTKRGWLHFDHVESADDIATVHQETLAFEWQNSTDIIVSPYEGPMIKFGGQDHGHRGIDLLVTPNHRMFVQRNPERYPSASGAYEFREASWLMNHWKKYEYRMLSAPSHFCGTRMESVDITPYVQRPGLPREGFNKSGDRRGMSPAGTNASVEKSLIRVHNLTMKQFVQLAGWYLTEGSCGIRHGLPDGQIRICQDFINPEHRAEIVGLLRSIPGLHVYDKTKDIRCSSMQLAVFLMTQFGHGSHHKHIPTWVKELESSSLCLLRDTMLKGDGCSHTRGGIERSYRSVSERLADDFVELCLKTGVRASKQWRAMETMEGGGIYEVNIARFQLRPQIGELPTVVDYQGMIGCVTVPNGTVIVRRNGIPVVSGNSYEQYHQSIRRCWRFGQSSPVHVDIIATTGEERVRENMLRKAHAADLMFQELLRYMRDAQSLTPRHIATVTMPPWLA